MKNCKYCLSEIDKRAKICPVCRKRQKQFRIGVVLFGVLLIIFLYIACGAVVSYISTDKFLEESKKIRIDMDVSNDSLSLKSDHYGESDSLGLYYIHGTVHNSSSKDYSYAQISFKIYDANGSVIGNCYDNVNGPGGYENWEFEAICDKTAVEISNYELVDITGW